MNISETAEVVYYKSPLGVLEIVADNNVLVRVDFASAQTRETFPQSALLHKVVRELTEYFNGARKLFTVPVQLTGTTFQQKSWEYLQTIPYGETRSYSEEAVAVGSPLAVRAVGMANHLNPVAIIVPCHRVIGKRGRILGYGGGLWREKWLLEHERKYASRE